MDYFDSEITGIVNIHPLLPVCHTSLSSSASFWMCACLHAAIVLFPLITSHDTVTLRYVIIGHP